MTISEVYDLEVRPATIVAVNEDIPTPTSSIFLESLATAMIALFPSCPEL